LATECALAVLLLLLQQNQLGFSADLSDLQWKLVKRPMAKATQVIVAGGEDQAIMVPSGAGPTAFLKLEGETVVSSQFAYTMRLRFRPAVVYLSLCLSID